MTFYIDSNAPTKRNALDIALKNLGIEGEIIYIEPNEPVVARPTQRRDIKLAAEKRALGIFPKENRKDCFSVGVQKGNTLNDVTEPFFLEGHCVVKGEKGIHYGISRPVELPLEIRRLVQKGTDLYDAYEKIFGPEIRNPEWSIYELLTGKPEDKILSKGIESALLPFFGKAAHYYLLG